MSEEKQKPKAITTHDVEAPRPVERERKPALTTNTIKPQLPTRPSDQDRKPAKGPMITTGNIEQFQVERPAGSFNAAEAVANLELDIKGAKVKAPETEAEPQQKKSRAKKAKEE